MSRPFLLLAGCALMLLMPRPVWAQAPGGDAPAAESVELNGDTVEYSVDGNRILAEGNVVAIKGDLKLTCDRIEFFRDTGMAYATGNVRLASTRGEISEMTGENLAFNFKAARGQFDGAKIYAKPYYGYGEQVEKIGDNHMKMTDDFITTCDHDKPHFRLTSSKMDIYPGEKLVARNVRMFVGKVPLLYLPKMSQRLDDKKPIVTFTPGYDKEWGMFLLSTWRYYFNENFKGYVHLDAREKKDVAWGIDVDYKTPNTGKGTIRTYYMNERSITSKHFYQPRPSPTIEKERFKVEWRHKWEIDEATEATMQYSKFSDNTFLEDYFEKQFDEDFDPSTFFLLTRALPSGTLSFRTDARVNRFVGAIERLPEISYSLATKELLNTGFYLNNTTTYSNLVSKTASPSEVRKNTMRVHTDNTLSYPFKLSFIEFNPFVGGLNTYYSKAKEKDDYGTIRGIFKTGSSMSTRFYRVFDVDIEEYGLNIHRLRHVVTPSVSYVFQGDPTTTPNQLDSFDGIDGLTNSHALTFSFENTLQTKRNRKSIDLLRLLISSDFHLKEHPGGKGGFDKVTTDIDFKPVDWLTFYFDSSYDTRKDYLTTANFGLYINGGEKWSFNTEKRWSREVDDQLTTELTYKINPKWGLRTYTRFDLRSGILKEQEFTVRRDLHAWYMDLNFNEKRRNGNEIWIVFTLKAFPDLALDFGTSFNKRKINSQSSEGD